MAMTREAIEALKHISTATITTVLLKKGLRNIWMRGTRPLRPGLPRLVGPAFTLRFVPARGLSTEAEPSARDIAALIDQIRKEDIRAVFLENIADSRLMAQLARETDAVVGGKLYSDALSPPGGPAASYVELMETNTAELVRALSRPPRPAGR